MPAPVGNPNDLDGRSVYRIGGLLSVVCLCVDECRAELSHNGAMGGVHYARNGGKKSSGLPSGGAPKACVWLAPWLAVKPMRTATSSDSSPGNPTGIRRITRPRSAPTRGARDEGPCRPDK